MDTVYMTIADQLLNGEKLPKYLTKKSDTMHIDTSNTLKWRCLWAAMLQSCSDYIMTLRSSHGSPPARTTLRGLAAACMSQPRPAHPGTTGRSWQTPTST
eukprot:scaffold470949_cov46-Prasinocladus_malaysianus.AAC.2